MTGIFHVTPPSAVSYVWCLTPERASFMSAGPEAEVTIWHNPELYFKSKFLINVCGRLIWDLNYLNEPAIVASLGTQLQWLMRNELAVVWVLHLIVCRLHLFLRL